MNEGSKNGLKVGVIGAGFVGLAAGAHLISPDIRPQNPVLLTRVI